MLSVFLLPSHTVYYGHELFKLGQACAWRVGLYFALDPWIFGVYIRTMEQCHQRVVHRFTDIMESVR